MSENGHFTQQNTHKSSSNNPPPKKMDFYMKTDPPFHPFHPFHPFLSNMPFIWVQASPFLGLDDALVKQIAMASLDDAMILAGGAEGRSDWRDQRQAPGGGPVEVIYLIGGFFMVPKSWGCTKMSLVVQLMIYRGF